MTDRSMPVSKSTKGAAKAAPIPGWVDGVVLIVILAVIGVALVLNWQSSSVLAEDKRLSWHLVRSVGIIAYAMLGSSTLWGIFLSSRIIKDWSPGTTSLLLHATSSWLAVMLSILHALLLLPDNYAPFRLIDILVPFGGPYRPLAVGLGILGMWLMLLITASFSVRKLIGQKAWRWLHYTSYATFSIITLHAIMAGTDIEKAGMRFLMVIFSSVVVVLLGWRVKQLTSSRKSTQNLRSKVT
ncbi:MAG: hypothetical protein ABI947_07355 [Chloroflexota bacterium]